MALCPSRVTPEACREMTAATFITLDLKLVKWGSA